MKRHKLGIIRQFEKNLEVYCNNNNNKYIFDLYKLCYMYFDESWHSFSDGMGNSIYIDIFNDKISFCRTSNIKFYSDIYFFSNPIDVINRAEKIVINYNSCKSDLFLLCNDNRLRCIKVRDNYIKSIPPLSIHIDLLKKVLDSFENSCELFENEYLLKRCEKNDLLSLVPSIYNGGD